MRKRLIDNDTGKLNSEVQVVHKAIRFKLVMPQGFASQSWSLRAREGKCLSAEGIELERDRVVEWLDRTYPRWEFRMVRVGTAAFNFIYDGLRGPRAQVAKETDDVDHGD